VITIRPAVPEYAERQEIPCMTLVMSCVSTGSGRTKLEALLDEGFAAERYVEWVHGEDHPVFIFRKAEE
jgi:hypothetical protein